MSDSGSKLILFSHLCSPVHVTGAEKVLLLFTRELMTRFECVLVVPEEGAIAAQARSFGIRVEVLDCPICMSVFAAAPHVLEEADALVKHPAWSGVVAFLARESPAYVWVNTSAHPLPAMAAQCLGIPVIWSVHETIMDTPHRQSAAEIVTANSQLIAGVSDTVLGPLKATAEQKQVWLPPYLIREELLPDGWPAHRESFRARFGWGEEHRIAGMLAAHLSPVKGLEPYVQAMLQVAAVIPHARFLVVGNPIEEPHFRLCRQLAELSGMADRFGWVSYVENIQHVIPAMDVMVVPSLIAEGFGMTALEGLNFGKPVVAFDSGGLAELMTATGNREFLVPAGDVQGLASQVIRLFSDRDLLQHAGQRSMIEAQRAFGVEAFRSRLDCLMERLPPPRLTAPSFLIRGKGPTLYLLVNGIKRPFRSVRALRKRGYRLHEAVLVNEALLHRIPTGQTIDINRRRRGRVRKIRSVWKLSRTAVRRRKRGSHIRSASRSRPRTRKSKSRRRRSSGSRR